MLQVLCSAGELDEDGEVIAVGDRIERIAGRRRILGWYGTELDEVEWHFDQYAVERLEDALRVGGRVTAIAAVMVRLTRLTPGGWAPRRGSAVLEPVRSTADARRPEPEIDWGPVSEPDAQGRAFTLGYPRYAEGDEQLEGWLITLEEESVRRGGLA